MDLSGGLWDNLPSSDPAGYLYLVWVSVGLGFGASQRPFFHCKRSPPVFIHSLYGIAMSVSFLQKVGHRANEAPTGFIPKHGQALLRFLYLLII
jgi:hypothetical protein